jgi:LAO/AO transport system kinase
MPESGILPQVRCYSGFYGLGIDEVLKMIFDYIDKVRSNGYFQYRRNEQSKYWMYESINEHLRNNFYYNTIVQSMLSEMSNKVLCGQITSFVAAKKLLDAYYSELKVNN